MGYRHVLALDLAATTGWAYGRFLVDDGYETHMIAGSFQSGFVHFKDTNSKGALVDVPRPERLQRFMGWLEDQFTMFGPMGDAAKDDEMVILYERPFCRGMGATRSGWGLAGVAEAVATNEGAAVLDITPKSIKLATTGKGGATKDEVTAALRQRGYSITQHDEADAVALLLAFGSKIEGK